MTKGLGEVDWLTEPDDVGSALTEGDAELDGEIVNVS